MNNQIGEGVGVVLRTRPTTPHDVQIGYLQYQGITALFTGALGSIHGPAANNGADDLDILDSIGVNLMGVIGENNKVRQLACRDAALDVLFE